MPFYRYTMFVQSEQVNPACGFSESWENEASTDANARNTMQTLIQRRAACLSQDWQIKGARIAKLSIGTSDVPPPTHSIIKQSLVQPLVCQGNVTGQLGASDTPWAAVLIELSKLPLTGAPDTRPRAQQMRGIPDSWWTANTLTIPAADQGAVQAFFNYIVEAISFGGGQVRIVANALHLQRYRGICIKRISSRRIGRPFGLVRGRQSPQAAAS